MSNIWIYKFDSTIQCDPESNEITLEEMRNQLATLIGTANILSMKKGARQIVQLCGMPTGAIR